jgi:DNA modification methylase
MKIKKGDLIILGEHKILCGDCSNAKNVKRLMGKEKIQLINCDPPYAISVVRSKKFLNGNTLRQRDIINDHEQTEEEYRAFTKKWLEAVKTYLDSKNAFYIFNSDKMIFAMREGIKDAGFHFAQLLIWIKNHAVIGRMDYLPMHELIAYGWYGTHKFRKSKDKSVLNYPKPHKNKLHPTMKPVGLIRSLILNSTEIGDIVYDGFLGSGTCLLACEQTKRRCFGFELDVKYCETIIKRYTKLNGIKARKENI